MTTGALGSRPTAQCIDTAKRAGSCELAITQPEDRFPKGVTPEKSGNPRRSRMISVRAAEENGKIYLPLEGPRSTQLHWTTSFRFLKEAAMTLGIFNRFVTNATSKRDILSDARGVSQHGAQCRMGSLVGARAVMVSSSAVYGVHCASAGAFHWHVRRR